MFDNPFNLVLIRFTDKIRLLLGLYNIKTAILWYFLSATIFSLVISFQMVPTSFTSSLTEDYLDHSFPIFFLAVWLTSVLFYGIFLLLAVVLCLFFPFLILGFLSGLGSYEIFLVLIEILIPIPFASTIVHIGYSMKFEVLKSAKTELRQQSAKAKIQISEKIIPVSKKDLERFWYCPYDRTRLKPHLSHKVAQNPEFIIYRNNFDQSLLNAVSLKKIPNTAIPQTRSIAEYLFAHSDKSSLIMISTICSSCRKIYSAPKLLVENHLI